MNNRVKLTLLIGTLLAMPLLTGCGNKEESAASSAGGTVDAGKTDTASRPLKGVGADDTTQRNVMQEEQNSQPGAAGATGGTGATAPPAGDLPPGGAPR
jgi:hypothetical protein